VGLATINADLNTHGSQFSSEVVFSVERQDPVAFSDGCDLFGVSACSQTSGFSAKDFIISSHLA
jgi:hypothetical protein